MQFIKVTKRLVLLLLLISLILLVILVLVINENNLKSNSTIVLKDLLSDTISSNKDSIRVIATDQYLASSPKQILQGKNYRNSWNCPIKVPILLLDTLYGGVQVIKEGGGKQTKSLRLQNDKGLILTLRSVNKFPDQLVPEYLDIIQLENIVYDGISAQHPYGALVAAKLSESLDILHTNPKPVYVPKQNTLGDYNSEYGNELYLLEYENKGTYNWTKFDSVTQIVDTEDLLKLKSDLKDSLKINEKALIRARLFDILIGDWDRHANQWGWVIKKEESNYTAEILPTDRDNAFFKSQGIINSIIIDHQFVPYLQNFHSKITNFTSLVYPFDVYFMSKIDKQQFLIEAKNIQRELDDDTIERAFRVWNNQLQHLNAQEISNIIKERRDHLVEIAIQFWTAISKHSKLDAYFCDFGNVSKYNIPIQCFDCDE